MNAAEDSYRSFSDAELAVLDHAFRGDLYEGQVALVTGGAGGIGRSICMLLGRLGAHIVTCGRDQAKLDGVQAALGEHGVSCTTHQMTIRDADQVEDMLAEVWGEYLALGKPGWFKVKDQLD